MVCCIESGLKWFRNKQSNVCENWRMDGEGCWKYWDKWFAFILLMLLSQKRITQLLLKSTFKYRSNTVITQANILKLMASTKLCNNTIKTQWKSFTIRSTIILNIITMLMVVMCLGFTAKETIAKGNLLGQMYLTLTIIMYTSCHLDYFTSLLLSIILLWVPLYILTRMDCALSIWESSNLP